MFVCVVTVPPTEQLIEHAKMEIAQNIHTVCVHLYLVNNVPEVFILANYIARITDSPLLGWGSFKKPTKILP